MANPFPTALVLCALLSCGAASSAAAAPDTQISANRTGLNLGTTNNGATRSRGQTVTITFSSGTPSWTATPSVPWLSVVPGSGSGSATLTVSLNPGTYPNGMQLSGAVIVDAPSVANAPLSIPVTLRAVASSLNPFGRIETPAPDSTGVVGGVPVTGWALDDIGITRVTIWRDPVEGEDASSSSNGKVFIGTATQVDGARPDVDSLYSLPGDYEAGWGYLLLTNMLPSQGNGTFTLSAYAEDIDGHAMQLGTRTITCDNAHATKPFGTIDTPAPGETISGTSSVNFGWTLTPQPANVPRDGSTIVVFVDGVPIGHPVYDQRRQDIETLFPGYANSSGAVGYYILDTTRLANGVHTIAWGVTDSAGRTEGIGSRYFSVLNSTSSSVMTTPALMQGANGLAPTTRQSAGAGDATGQPVAALSVLPSLDVPAYAQQGFEPNAPLQIAERRDDGRAVVSVRELDVARVTVGAPIEGGGTYQGYLVNNGRLGALPPGSFLDAKTGEFFWHPGVGFVGRYDFVFVRRTPGFAERIPISIEIGVK